jgi:PKD repeat protein
LKRIIFILALLLLVSPAFALELNLESSEVSVNQSFNGYLTLDIVNETYLNELFLFIIDSPSNVEILNGTLGEVYSSIPGASILSEKFESSEETALGKDVEFTSEGSQTEIALDFIDAINMEMVSNLTFTINGDNSLGDYPTDIQIDLDSDGVIDYVYQGPLVAEYELLSSDYLGDEERDASVQLRGATEDVVCQKVYFEPSSNYRINVEAKKEILATADTKLKVEIDDSPKAKPSCSGDECACILNPTDSFSEVSCELNKEILEAGDKYVCMFVSGGEAGSAYFSIGTDKDDAITQGYRNGIKKSLDFMVNVERQLFERQLKGVNEEVEIDISSIAQEGYMLPITITSSSKGTVEVSSLSLNYISDDFLQTMNSFLLIDYLPERINFEGEANVSLNLFQNLKAPIVEGDYSMYVAFEGSDSDLVDFEVISGPSAVIQRTSDAPYIGEIIEFTGINSLAIGNDSIVSYAWNFGDNSTANGSDVLHYYSDEGTYTVQLTITDSEGLTGTSSVVLTVASLEESAGFLINDTKVRLNSLTTKVLAETANIKALFGYLGMVTLAEDSLANISLLEIDLDAALINTNETEKELGLIEVVSQLNGIRDSIALDYQIITTEFNAKPLDILGVPSAVQMGLESLEKFEERVLIAQDSVSVDAKVYELLLKGVSSTEKLIIVEKSVTGEGSYYEYLGLAVKREILNPISYEAVSSNVYKFSESPLVYILESTIAEDAFMTSTMAVPLDLASVIVGGIVSVGSCGDGLCDLSRENDVSCPLDCAENKPWWIIIVVVLVLIGAGGFLAYTYRSRLFNKNSLSRPQFGKVLPPKILFKSEGERESIKSYIRESVKKGFTDIQINLALKKKGWNQNQIAQAVIEVRSEK